MRWIDKAGESAAIREYLTAQSVVGHGLDYPTFASTGGRGRQLRNELIAEQFGLCAYTGAGIDERVGLLSDPSKPLRFSAHNEHLKAQSVCKTEMESAGKEYGVDLGDDMAFSNIVAALLVSGAGRKVEKADLFGAAHRENDPVSVLPTDRSCEERFAFDLTGQINASDPRDQEAEATIQVLNLRHETLKGWRESAIGVFLEAVETRQDAEKIIAVVTSPVAGRLPEYAFAIRQVVQTLLNAADGPPPNSLERAARRDFAPPP